jgi:glutaminyl-peptide cyclotransferase
MQPFSRVNGTLLGIYAFAALIASAAPASGQAVRPEVVATFPHDPGAFTQGLLLHQGKFYESTGLLGRSTLRRVAPASGEVEESVALASDLFGEGLALVSDRLIQLTWQNNVALVYDLEFNTLGSFDYSGEGWGLCHDGTRLVMSDGSASLTFRDPSTFAVEGSVEVTRAGTPVTRLNELECVGRLVYANVWQTDTIVRIDPATGAVLTTIDASELLTPAEAAAADVLNGIAFNPATGHFYLTGKLWPKLFEVRFPFDPYGGPPGTDAGNDAGNNAEKDATSDAPRDSANTGVDAPNTAGRGGTTSGDAAPGAGGSGATALPNTPVQSDADSSCGCRTTAPPGPSSGLFFAALAVLVCVRKKSMLA